MIHDGRSRKFFTRLKRTIADFPGSDRLTTLINATQSSLSIIPEMPRWVQIETTNRCNFDCEMCPRQLHKLPDVDMDRDTFQFIVSRLGLEHGSLITLFGLGEPLMNDDTFWMVGEVKKRGWRAGFTTNGVMLTPKRQAAIIESGLDNLRISVDDDGLGNSRERLHSAASAVIERTGELLRLRDTSSKPEILWNVVASTDTQTTIPRLIRKAAELGVDGVNIINLVPRFSTVDPIPEDRRIFLFEEWHSLGCALGMPVHSTYRDRFGLRRFFYGHRRECPQLFDYAYITMDGKVSPCCHLPRTIVGDLSSQTLKEIWTDIPYRRFRKNYRRTKTCRDCRLLLWK